MIRLGTVAPIGFDEFDPAEWLACYREMGCEVVQAYRNQTRPVSLEQMRDGIAAGGMPCDSLHGVFGEEFDPSALDEPRRRFAVETYRREGELCRKLGGKLVVVHCASIRREGVSRTEYDQRVEQLKKSVEQLGRFGADSGVLYAFENLPGYHAIGYDVPELAGVLRDVGAPNTGMCFDSGHANMVCDAAEAVRQTAGQMIYAHISDNDGREDQHEMITCGSIDADALARALREVGYDGTFMLEVFYPAERLRRLLRDGIAERLSGLLRAAAGEPAEEGKATCE